MDNHIDSWIERTHTDPLSLIIRHHDGFLDPVDSALTFFANHKWKSITLDGDTSVLILYLVLEHGGTLVSHTSQTNKIRLFVLLPVIDDKLKVLYCIPLRNLTPNL